MQDETKNLEDIISLEKMQQIITTNPTDEALVILNEELSFYNISSRRIDIYSGAMRALNGFKNLKKEEEAIMKELPDICISSKLSKLDYSA